jgi:iron complex transport system substrate-binding protein
VRQEDIVPKKLIVSLLPGATEMIVAVGGGDQLIGVSHECDWPAMVRSLPRVTTTPIDIRESSAAIHRAVQDTVAAGRAVIGIDADLLRSLRPDIIVTQQLCDVCAVADGEAVRLAAVMDPAPEVLALSGTTLAGVWDDIRRVGAAIGRAREGEGVATALAGEVTAIAHEAPRRPPRVVAIEWLEPLFLAGHWVPEMIAAAGGIDVGAAAGSHSVVREWNDVMALDPELVLVILCGFDAARGGAELDRVRDPFIRDWLAAREVAVLDGNAYTSRPGPRLVEGIRLMRAAIQRLVHQG